MAAEPDPLTLWFETAAPDSVAGRFRAAARRSASPPVREPLPEVGGSADPRLAGLESWSALAAFVEGYGRGRDPAGTGETGTGTVRTTLRSLWTGSRCAECGHTFRAGDAVRIRRGQDGAPGTAVHDDPEFPCSGAGSAASEPEQSRPEVPAAEPSVAERFAAALAPLFPLAPGLKSVRLTARSFGLAKPYVDDRHNCMGCGHTLRVGERVVRCPCGLPKARCLNTVHHDPANGLNCYAEWVAYPKWRQRCGNPAAPEQP